MNLVKRFNENKVGRDFAVGDIHGHFTVLRESLDRIGFNPDVDGLFSVGDLIDRGPESDKVIEWLDKPWFHPVRGNHDDYVCRYDTCDIGNWVQNGGIWFSSLTEFEQGEFAVRFMDLPIAIEVETSAGVVGLVHADCPFPSWTTLIAMLSGGANGGKLRAIKNACMWSRRRFELEDPSGVVGLMALVVGHTPLERPIALGNVIHIDTMGWLPNKGGSFTLLELSAIQSMA